MSQSQNVSANSFRIQLVDVAALVVGYGMAAVLFRAFWPKSGVTVALGLFAVGFYLWLGLAMSGPLLLLRRDPRTTQSPKSTPTKVPDPHLGEHRSRTWAEIAWLLIGVYWIVMGVFVLPIRLESFRFGDTVLFGLVPIVAGLVLRLFGPKASPDYRAESWTHRAAVGLLATWPVAWFCLIVLGRTLL
jgi:hypothetical protein